MRIRGRGGSAPHTPTYSHTLSNPNQSSTLNASTKVLCNVIT